LPLGAIFSQKKWTAKMLRLCGPAAEKPKVLKSWFFYLKKSPVHAAKNAENGAFLAHLEPEILLIEAAYFSAATEYTFSAHCTVHMKEDSTEEHTNG
jgi:hypothetical protein